MTMKTPKKTPKKTHELIEHTADVGLRVFAKDEKALFINAALGMFDIIAKRRQRQPAGSSKTKFNIELKARNREELLISWLSELLTLFDIHAIIFTRFKISHQSSTQIKGLAWAEPLNKKMYSLKTEIKAVTYHSVRINKTAQCFMAQIYFDT